jgi:hypothetical protein
LTLDPGKFFFRIPDLGSQTRIFESSVTVFLVKSIIILFLYLFKNKIIFNYVKFEATNKGRATKFFPLPLLLLLLDSGSGYGKNIPDPTLNYFLRFDLEINQRRSPGPTLHMFAAV